MRRPRFVGQTWRLRCGLLFAGMNRNKPGYPAAAVGPEDAEIFDSRDNRELKRRYYSAAVGMPFVVEEV
jgi:hypothetical protein